MTSDTDWKVWLRRFWLTQYTPQPNPNYKNSQEPEAVSKAIFNLQFAIPFKKCYDCKYYKYDTERWKTGKCTRYKKKTDEHSHACKAYSELKDRVKWEQRFYTHYDDKYDTAVFPEYYPWKVHWNSYAAWDELKEWVHIIFMDGICKHKYVTPPGEILIALILSNELKQPWYKLVSIGREICYYLDNVDYGG